MLYFGSTIGIREQLRHVHITGMNLNLADVFTQRDVSRGSMDLPRDQAEISTDELLKSRLPEVITVYSPIDPKHLLKAVKPAWVAIDFGDSGRLPWLEPLLAYSMKTSVPFVGWGYNPFSDNLSIASRYARVFVWPFKTTAEPAVVDNAFQASFAEHLKGVMRHVEPLVLAGDSAEILATFLGQASGKLASVHASPAEPLLSDALALHWRLLRSIEGLCVPIDLYEAEAEKVWGLSSLGRLKNSCDRFREAARTAYPLVGPRLAEVGADLDAAVDWVRTHEPPLWTALCNLCHESQPTGNARLLVFPGYGRKRLFQLALLARYNIADDDLCELGTWITSTRELRSFNASLLDSPEDSDKQALPVGLVWNPIVVGLPSSVTSHKMDCLLHVRHVQYLILPHQVQGLRRRVREWLQWLTPNPASHIALVSELSGVWPPPVVQASVPTLVVDPPHGIEVQSLQRRASERLQKLVALADPAIEVAALFDATSDDDDDTDVVSDRLASEAGAVAPTEDWCSEALLIEFDQAWKGLFALDDTVNLIVPAESGFTTEERFVRSLKRGDRVMLIQGSRRQSLYDLIVERVHKHPAIELHLALIRRWRDDLRVAVHRWQDGDTKTESHALDDLLRELITRGSRLTSTATLYHWLRGWTLCPQDPEDIRRAAEALNMVFLMKNYKSVGKAASRVRGLHRSLSNRLGRWLSDQAPAMVARASDDVIDEELGLTFEDFRSSVIVVKVLGVKTRPGPFLRSGLGRVFQEADQ